jgi:hypothetical protein
MLAGRPPTGVEILSSYGSVESACTDEISSLPWDTATPDLMGNGLEFFFFFFLWKIAVSEIPGKKVESSLRLPH